MLASICFFIDLNFMYDNPLGSGILNEDISGQVHQRISVIKILNCDIFAPLFGWIADISIPILFLIIAGLMLISNFFFLRGEGKREKEETSVIESHNQKQP